MGSENKKRDASDAFRLFNVEILGLNLGELVKAWVGDPEALLDPERLEDIKRRVEDRRKRFESLRGELQAKTKGAVHLDYSVRIKTLDGSELRLGGGQPPPKLLRVEAKAGEAREPMHDILDKGDHVDVIVEVPGVGEGELQIEICGNALTLKTVEGSERKYWLKLELPARVLDEGMKKTFNNGVLTITLRKQGLP